MNVKPHKLFSGNPYQTPAGELVAKATDASLLNEKWTLIKLVCDYINVNTSAGKDAVKAIKKRLHKNKNFVQISITLSLLEACVKKCNIKFRKYVMTEDFCMNTLLDVVSPKHYPDVLLTQRILGIIQEWAFVFNGTPELNGVKLVYQELLNEGACFPPPKSVSIVSGSQQSTQSTKFKQTVPAKLSAQQVTKLLKDVSMVNSNVKVLSEMLIELNPLTCCVEDFLFMQEISKTCHAMHGRAFELFSQVNESQLTAALLTAMDDVNNVLLRYDRFEKFREAKNADYVFPESLSSASSLRSVSTGAENIYVERSPSHLSTTSSSFAPNESSSPGHYANSNIYSIASDVEELSLESKAASSAPAVSYPMINEQAFLNNNNVEDQKQLSNGKIKSSISNYVQQSVNSWDEV